MITLRMKKITTLLALSVVWAAGQPVHAAEDMADMDHSNMDHGTMDHGTMDHGTMDHGSMQQDAPAKDTDADMQGMDHGSGSSMDMPPMQGGSPPADARDPHGYSGGYRFDAKHSHEMSDVAYWYGLMIDRLENVQSRDNAFNAYELQAWFGKDYNRLVLKSEGEVDGGQLHEARNEVLWSHAVAPHWDTQLGARYDSGIVPHQKWLALGVQGLAPYWFEVDVTAYLAAQRRMALRLSVEYELLLTQKLILQPRVEANFYRKSDQDREIGSGLTSMSAGLRMRYEIRRQFAPYVGIEWSGKYGGTADYAREQGERTNETRLLAGLRFWF